mgnify:CR=1 FL=1
MGPVHPPTELKTVTLGKIKMLVYIKRYSVGGFLQKVKKTHDDGLIVTYNTCDQHNTTEQVG